MKQQIFITGGTGYIGSRLIKALLEENNFSIKALIRKGSENKLPEGCEIIFGNALDAASYSYHIAEGSIFIHLIGVAHPSPAKKEAFQKIDWVSIQEAVKACKEKNITHFIYLSVNQFPSGIMKDYQEVRAAGEKLIIESGMNASFIRPWYVLGPGHWWPVLLKPIYWLAYLFPGAKEKAMQRDLVTIKQMINTLMYTVKHTATDIKSYEIADIQKMNN